MEENREETGEGHHHYVLTGDSYSLIAQWGNKNSFVVPSEQWFQRNSELLRAELALALVHNDIIVDLFSYRHILNGMHDAIYKAYNHNPEIELGSVVSLDRVYTMGLNWHHKECFMLEVNRAINMMGDNLERTSRPGAPSLGEQFRELRSVLMSKKVIVVDDGIWTGRTMCIALEQLEQHKIHPAAVVVGVRRQNGCDEKLGNIFPNNMYETELYEEGVRPADEWVCARDFFPGVPNGGRTVIDSSIDPDLSVGAYYINRAEWLKEWASVDDPDGEFRKFCFERSLDLFKKIEEFSEKSVLIRDLARVPLFVIEAQGRSEDRFRDLLQAKIESFV